MTFFKALAKALVGSGKVFRTIAKLPERRSDRQTQALGAALGIEPGTSRTLPLHHPQSVLTKVLRKVPTDRCMNGRINRVQHVLKS